MRTLSVSRARRSGSRAGSLNGADAGPPAELGGGEAAAGLGEAGGEPAVADGAFDGRPVELGLLAPPREAGPSNAPPGVRPPRDDDVSDGA